MPAEKKSRRIVANPVQLPHSDLQLILSEVKWCSISAAVRKEDSKPESQPVMVDFDIIRSDKQPSQFFVTLLVELENDRKSKEVLLFSISTLSMFEFRQNGVKTDLPAEEKDYGELYSMAISTSINLVRGYLVNYLAPTVYRDYLLPLINAGQLMDKKYRTKFLSDVPSNAPVERPENAGGEE